MKKYFFLLFLFVAPAFSSATEVACTMEYAPVCGLPPMPKCQDGMVCNQAMPGPKTYGNTCMLDSEGATRMYSGECAPTTGIKVCTKEYVPVCGLRQVNCIKAPCNPVRTDYANRCMAEADGVIDIVEGTCKMSESSLPIVGGDKDTHGCIPSAGYSWDDSMKLCIRPWEYQDKVDWAYENKITRYTTLGEFKYGNTLTRQEAAAFITRYLIEGLGRPEALCKLAYKDGSSIDTSLTPSISRACGLGVMNGNNGYFFPKGGLTRGEALAVLIRAIEQKKQDETMKPWYQGYMDRAFERGLVFANMKGFDEPITRGEFIEWLKRLGTTGGQSTIDENLIGDWKLQSYQEQDMVFAGSGQILHFSSSNYQIKLCNSIGASYTVSNGVFTSGIAMSTLMACADTTIIHMEGAWNLDGASYVIQSPRGGSSASISLVITTKNGGIFTFTKE